MKTDRDQIIWILGTQQDPHVARVSSLLYAKNISVIVIDYNEPSDIHVSFNGDNMTLSYKGVELHHNDAIWSRCKLTEGGPYYFTPTDNNLDAASQHCVNKLREQQWIATYSSILCTHRGKIINRGSANWPKPYQQIVASRVGFSCPPSIISSSKKQIVDFFQQHINVVTKGALTTSIPIDISISTAVMTMKVSIQDITSSEESDFDQGPVFFQRQIFKKLELRIVATKYSISAFAVDSQKSALTAVDWRYGQSFLKFERYDLPKNIQSQIARFLEIVSCDFGVFDFILDEEGQYWFLECNSDGQWGWLETEPDISVSKIISECIERVA